jgi:hypothetical protein
MNHSCYRPHRLRGSVVSTTMHDTNKGMIPTNGDKERITLGFGGFLASIGPFLVHFFFFFYFFLSVGPAQTPTDHLGRENGTWEPWRSRRVLNHAPWTLFLSLFLHHGLLRRLIHRRAQKTL